MKQVTMAVRTLEATVRKVGSNVIPGGYILNQLPNQPLIWINRNELQNALSRQEMAPNIPCSELVGADMVLDYHEITQKDIDEAIARGDQALNTRGEMVKGYVININGRSIPFTQPGTKYVLKSINLANCDFSANTVNKIKVSAASFDLQASRNKARESAVVVAAATAPVRQPVSSTTIDAPVNGTEDKPKVIEMPKILEGIKDDASGNKVNADDTPLTGEQQEALALWVEAVGASELINA